MIRLLLRIRPVIMVTIRLVQIVAVKCHQIKLVVVQVLGEQELIY